MKRETGMRAFSLLFAMLLGCAVMIPLVSAGEISISPMKDPDSGEKDLTATMILNPDGTLTKAPDTAETGKTPLLKAVEIPDTWKKPDASASKSVPSDQDWAYLRSIMTGLSDEERDRLVEETKQIYDGTSALSKEEQSKILQQIGEFLVQAEDNTPAIRSKKYFSVPVPMRSFAVQASRYRPIDKLQASAPFLRFEISMG